MPRVINVGRFPAGATAPDVRSIAWANGQTFLQGSPLVATAGVVSECAANPVVIYGFAAEPASSRAGYGAANSPTVITGRNQEVTTFLANSTQLFTAALVNGSAVLVAPTAADIGTSIGLSKRTINGVAVWVADKAATAAIQIGDIDLDGSFVYFKVLAASIQIV